MGSYVTDPEDTEIQRKPEPPLPAPRTRQRVLIWGGLFVVAAVALGWYLHTRGRISTDDAEVDGHIVPIAARITGSVSAVLVDDNQQVKAGEVLVRIDPRDYQARLDQARAALATAEAQSRGADVSVPLMTDTTATGISSAEAQLAVAEADLAKAKATAQQSGGAELAYAAANVEAAKATYDRAQADLARMKPLVEKAEISQLQYDAYVAGARVAESNWKAAGERLLADQDKAASDRAAVVSAQAKVEQFRALVEQSRTNRKQVAISVAQASSASASVAQARANVEAAELLLSYTTITAPVNGVVTRKTVQLGQILQPGQSLMTLVPLEDIWVTANYKETQLETVHAGQKAEVEVDLYGRSFPGHVDSIAGATGARLSLLPPENATGNYVKVVQRIPVKIVLDPLPAGYVLRPGMNVDATIINR
jgi:membrane fusion protein (multidrug efflux system)